MKRVITGLVVGICLIAVPRAQASTIGVTSGAKYTCSVENCGTDLSKAANTFVAVQQVVTLSRVSAGEYSGPAAGSAGSPITLTDTLREQIGNVSGNPEPASMLLLGTGIAGLVIRRRRNQK